MPEPKGDIQALPQPLQRRGVSGGVGLQLMRHGRAGGASWIRLR